jgi:hypothetical protein
MENGYFFLLIDKYVPATFGVRAWEGPLISNEISSFYKGRSYFIPIQLNVMQHGFWTKASDTIAWR